MLAGVKSLLWQSQPALDAAKGWGASFLQSLGGGSGGGGRHQASSTSPPPWAGLDPGARERVLAISQDASGLLRGPPPGSGFGFELEAALPMAAAALEADEGLRRMRFELVPRRLSEEEFWRNYFYRVSLIRRSAKLAIAQQQQKQQQQHRLELQLQEREVRASPPAKKVPSPQLPRSGGLATLPASATSSCDSFERLDCDDAEWEREMQLEIIRGELATSSRRSGSNAAQ